MSSIRSIDSHQYKHDLNTLMSQEKTILPSANQMPENSLQKMEYISQAVNQTRTLLQRRIRFNPLSNHENSSETPTLSTEDGEDVFSKLHGLNSKTVLQGKARQFLQRMRRQSQYSGQPLSENEENTDFNLSLRSSNQESNEFTQQTGSEKLFAQEMQETLGEEVSNLDMYLILGQAKQMLAQENSKLSKDVNEQLDAVFNEHQDEIITKVNSIDEASIYGGQEKKRVTQFLEAYYIFIFKVRTPNDMLMVYLNSFDRAEFEQISNLFNIANLKAQHQRLLPCIHQNTMNDILPFMNNRSAIFSLLDYIASSKDKLAKRFDQLQQSKTPQVNEKSLLKSIQELFMKDDDDLNKSKDKQKEQQKEKQQEQEQNQAQDNKQETIDDDDLFDQD